MSLPEGFADFIQNAAAAQQAAAGGPSPLGGPPMDGELAAPVFAWPAGYYPPQQVPMMHNPAHDQPHPMDHQG